MAKGKFKRRVAGGHFKAGNKCSPRNAKKSVLTKTLTSASTDTVRQDGSNRTLRSSQRVAERRLEDACAGPSTPGDVVGDLGNRVMNLNKIIYLFNSLVKAHANHQAGSCTELAIALGNEKKVGLGSKLQFNCQNCSFASDNLPTYVKKQN